MAVRNSVGITGSALGRREPCAKCGLPVFLAERLHVGQKLYHRTCFRCARCDNQLSLENYYETETDGQHCCETCPDEEDSATAAEQPELNPTNNVQSRIKLFDKKPEHGVLAENRSRSLSDEEKANGLQFDEDEYSSYFENAVEEADERLVQENSALSKARNNFLSVHLLNEAFDEIDTKEGGPSFDDVEDEFESLYKQLSHEDKSNVKEFDEMKIEHIDTPPPPLPVTEPPDLLASPSSAEPETQPETVEHLEGKPDEGVVQGEPEPAVNSSDKDSVKDDQQLTASDTRNEKVTNITENVTKDTNRISLVKSRMLIFENAEKSASSDDGKSIQQLGDNQKADVSDVPSENDVIVISDTNSSVVSTNPETDLSASEKSVEIISDASVSAVELETKTDDSLSKSNEPVIIISDESQVVKTPPDDATTTASDGCERKVIKYDPDCSDSVSVGSSVSKNPPVDTQTVHAEREILTQSIFETTNLGESTVTIDSSILESSESPKARYDYPEELNPFGDDATDVDGKSKSQSNGVQAPHPVPTPRKGKNVVLKSTNPFGSSDDENEEEVVKSKPPLPPQPATRNEEGGKRMVKAPRVSLNPFWSEDEEPSDEDTQNKPVPLPRSSKPVYTPEPRPRKSGLSKNGDAYDSNSSLSSMSSSVSQTPGRKKKPAPPPPTQKAVEQHLSPQTSKQASPQISPKLTPRARKTRKAPPPPTSTPYYIAKVEDSPGISPINDNLEMNKCQSPDHSKSSAQQVGETQYYSVSSSSAASNDVEKEKISKDEKNRNRQSQNLSSPTSEQSEPLQRQSSIRDKSTHGKWKRKKGPAPALPVIQRRQINPLPLAELRRELDIIEMQQQGLEKQGVKLEQLIRDKCEGPEACDDTAFPPEVEDLVLELFEVVNEKNELFRRQAELMYLRRQQRLEEEYADLEYQIRCLMERPERNKTDSDKAREEELINRLVEVVERRNEIVECLEMDRVREAEEDQSINSRLNSIAAKREEETQSIADTPVKLSKKEKKKIKKEKKLKEKGRTLDVDKDVDESEFSFTSMKEKKKKKWF